MFFVCWVVLANCVVNRSRIVISVNVGLNALCQHFVEIPEIYVISSKDEMLNECRLNVGPAS